MKLDNLRRSRNIEDRRAGGGQQGGGLGGFGGGGGGGRGIGVRGGGGLGIVVLIVLFLIFGGGSDLAGLLGPAGGQPQVAGSQQAVPAEGVDTGASRTAEEAATADRVAAVMGSTEDFWGAYFARAGETYRPATLVMYRGQTRSPCGTASGATGPFYCPADKKVYLDLSFFDEMARSLGARGDFAQAYVVAHEIAHHVQDELGILGRAHQVMQRERGEAEGADSVAVRLELQADCMAGLWAGQTVARDGSLEPGDIEEALGAATAVGDDRLQQRAQGYAVPDSFTHGSSEQRARWFTIGLRASSLDACDTFRARTL
jgi:uncharacterized protein